MRSVFALLFALCVASLPGPAGAAGLDRDRAELEAGWRARIQALLDQGKLPKIDMETSLKREQIEAYIPDAFATMDALGIALIAADGYQDPKDGREGYRWSTYILELVNRYPDRFVPTANGGTNPNWLKRKGGKPKHFIDQMEKYVSAGVYMHMGEFDFRHYMSSHQCAAGRTDRDSDIPLGGENGQRVFRLSEETGVPFVIHLEPEDAPLAALEEMLAAYPKAKVIVAHFGQLRHPERQTRFTPAYARRLLETYPNLYYDLSTGHPNRVYRCAGQTNDGELVGDTVLWAESREYQGSQTDTVAPEWLAVLRDFPDRFVFATDYGGGRPPLPVFLERKVANFNLIIRDLPDAAKHAIAYRNAWKLLTGKDWE